MDIHEGTTYHIIDMPSNVSVDAIDGIVNEFAATFLKKHPTGEFLLRMDKIPQLHKAGLNFMLQLNETIAKSGGTLVIAEAHDLSAIIDNALKSAAASPSIHVFKTILDFEKYRFINIPLEMQKNNADKQGQTTPAESSDRDLSSLRVMIICSSMVDRNNLRTILKRLSIQRVSEAKDCTEVTRMSTSASQKIDIMLLNISESGIQGPVFLKSLNTQPNYKNAKVLLFGADKVSELLLQEAMGAGAKGKLGSRVTERELKDQLLAIV